MTEEEEEEKNARSLLENSRWGRRPICPYCSSSRVVRYSNGVTHYCTPCRRQFTVTVGSIFEGSHLSASQLVRAMRVYHQSEGTCSTSTLAFEIQVTMKTARGLIRKLSQAVSEPAFWQKPEIRRKRSEPQIRRANGRIIVTAYKGYNSVPFANILKLYVPVGAKVADVTHGRGMFWAHVDRSKYEVFATDISEGVDLRSLPYSDCSIDAVVLDPPYMHVTTGTAYKMKTNMASLYKVNMPHHPTERGHKALMKLYLDGAREAHRVLRAKGVLILKTMDEVVGTKQMLTHVDIINELTKSLYSIEDLFVLMRQQAPMLSHKTVQKHARKNHSYFLIFRKKSKRS